MEAHLPGVGLDLGGGGGEMPEAPGLQGSCLRVVSAWSRSTVARGVVARGRNGMLGLGCGEG